MKRSYTYGSHSVYEMHYHLILVVKYRRPVISDKMSNRLRSLFIQAGGKHKIHVEAWNHDRDHIHALFTAAPDTTLSAFIGAYKSMSSRIIKAEYPDTRRYLWEEMFWSPSYMLFTTGGVTADIIENYIRHQGENHDRKRHHA